MPYIGNTIRAADDYRLIDDISSGFNGSTTSFALQVAGSAPVPFPKSPQQVLISVNGVIQEPDPTGTSGFNLVGTNIVFSSAPTNGHAFFGIIYATADYLNSGGNFPTGSLGAPSITFVGDEDTGIYRKGSGSVGFVSDATEIANFDSNGITISSGNLIIPDSIIHNGDTNTKIRFPAADTITAETGGTERQRINSDGQLLINQTASSGLGRQLQIGSNTGFGGVSLNRFSADTGSSGLDFIKSRNATIGSNTIVQNDDNLGAITWRGADGTDFATPAAQIKVAVDGTPGSNDMPGRIMLFTTADGASSLTERLRIDNAGNVGIGITNPTTTLHLDASGGAVLQLQRTSSNASNRLAISHDGTDGTLDSSNALLFRNNGAERARITSAGRLGIGTTNPDAKLKINGSSAYTVANSGRSVEGLDIQATAGGSGNFGGAISLGSSGSGRSAIAALQDGADSDRTGLVFITHDSNTAADNSAEKMRIDSTGRVGIGTTAPSDKLHVRGASAAFTAFILDNATNSSNPYKITFGDQGQVNHLAVANREITFGTNNAERMRINNIGQVQIGDTTAADTSEMLKVDGAGASDHCGIGVKTSNNVHDGYIAFHDSDANFRGQVRYDHSVDAMFFNTAASERMRIDSSGNVTVKTDNVAFSGSGTLRINSGSTFGTLNLDGGATNRGGEINLTGGSNGGQIQFRSGIGTGQQTEKMRLDSSGRLLHGVTASVDVGSTAAANTQIHSGNSVLQLAIAGYGNNSGGAIFALGHSRSGTVGDASGQLSNNDEIGTIRFAASDGTDMENTAAFITGLIDGNVSSNSTPGELAFGVNNGAGSNANCILIRSDFDIFLGGASGANRMFQSNSRGFVYDHDGGGAHPFIGVQHSAKTTGAAAYISFQSQTSERGKIAESNSGNNVTYNTSSDYRLKQDEVLISDGITRLKQLKPYQFKWKDNLEYGYVDGFFAHEVGDVIKGSATGSKDEVVTQEGLDDGTYNKNRSVGDMVAQGLDYSRLTPLLTAALQEAIAKIETLETKVAALEAA
jgi:hypothetical protein